MAKGFNEQECRNIQLTFDQSTSNLDFEFRIIKIGEIAFKFSNQRKLSVMLTLAGFTNLF